MSDARCCFLTPSQLHILREVVEPIGDAFGGFGAYLVGSCLTRADYRDVDVRVILEDDRFAALFGADLDQYPGKCTRFWMLMTTTLSERLSRVTGLKVDFQVQAQSIANRDHSRRDVLMVPPYTESEHD